MTQRLKTFIKITSVTVICVLAAAQLTRVTEKLGWCFGMGWSDNSPVSQVKEISHRSEQNAIHVAPLQSISLVKTPTPEIALKVFGDEAFRIANVGQDQVNLQDCILSKHIQPHYHVCTFSAKKDAYVSGSIRKGKGWEGHISSMLVKMLKSIGERAILLDVGTNIGCHALYGAINNFHVFGVEPQAVNLVKVYQAAILNNSTDNIKLFQHTIDSGRRQVVIKQTYGNIGGSFVTGAGFSNGQGLLNATSVLLSDIFEHVVHDKYDGIKELDIVMKIDIEHYECRAFLGSPGVLNNDRFVIRYVVMEWTYRGMNKKWKVGSTGSVCPPEKVTELANLFVKNGYKPFSVQGGQKDLQLVAEWNEDIIWVHNMSKNVL